MNINVYQSLRENCCRFFLFTALFILVAGCKKDNTADLLSLLGTVPSDAGMVAALNMHSMADKAGGKVKDGKALFPMEMLSALNSDGKKNLNKALEVISNGESGIVFSSIVVFSEGYYTYVTGLLNDTEAFKKLIDQEGSGSKFSTTDGVDICGDVAIKGNQFWIGNRSSAVDPTTIKGFTVLSEKQSYLSNDLSNQLLEMDHDITIVADVGGLISQSNAKLTSISMVKLILGAVFSDPQYLKTTIDFETGEAEIEVSMLNSKLKPAEYLLPKAQISQNAVSSLQNSGNAVLAIAMPQKLIDKFKNIGGSFGASVNTMLAPFDCIDGTIAAVVADPNRKTTGVSGLIETNGNSKTALNSLLSAAGLESSTDGKLLLFTTKEAPTGKLNGKMVAPEFKDAFIAGAFDSEIINGKSVIKADIEMVWFFIKIDDGSLMAEIKIESKNKKENFLKALCTK